MMSVPSHDKRLEAKLPTPHLRGAYSSWKKLYEIVNKQSLSLDGYSLDIASVVALARHGCKPFIEQNDQISKRMDDSIKALQENLAKGYFLYGVNTGFGGSADTRTTDLLALQQALMQHTQSAVLPGTQNLKNADNLQRLTLHSMPTSWTKASILLRCNANIRGHSAMSRPVIDAMIELLRQDITPIVPLRGSISASGDIMPLSYVAGAIQGNPDVLVRVRTTTSANEADTIMTAQKALEHINIAPIVLGPKEGLALINGTAPSAAVASLALHDAQQLVVISQPLIALTCEALAANVEWAHPFVSQIRPHKGQIEVAQNIRLFLSGSRLTTGLETTKERLKSGLVQDRYALRSSPQWLGPQLEDLESAASQLVVELNSTSDNPVVDSVHKDVHCGANFQAVAVTSATEKTRACVQMIGRLVFGQTTEMINHNFSNGLPPNLAADDPSLSFCLKGIDVNMAAYQSELAYLANPVSTHVQSAEMHNQAVNSLALLSARYTVQSVELLSLMVAAAIYTGCQAVDLRVLHQSFLSHFAGRAEEIFTSGISTSRPEEAHKHFLALWSKVREKWYETASLDAHERCCHTAATVAVFLVESPPPVSLGMSTEQICGLRDRLEHDMLAAYQGYRERFFKQPTTAKYLGLGARALYEFVRGPLGVPMHRGLIEHPSPEDGDGNMLDGRAKKTIGSWVSIIYEAICDGRVFDSVMNCVEASGYLSDGSGETGL